ncbi:MAG TPA: LLM class flavin-dependent oxidoreductase [Solirubrobacteraceae bacterium]|nr:LLM class flavin-dependent oxidoreductase [Solirubrobacteraceae bacterium]
MRFAITLNMERLEPSLDIREAARSVDELAAMADEGGFDIIFVPEHHAIEMTIGPNPFIQLAHWARELPNARLGTAVIAAPYWHPIRLAGEAALFDLLSGGRLELGIGRGAYQYEFDRMGGGIDPDHARGALAELVPAVKALWRGDYEHRGSLWSFPAATAVPKPLQSPHPPIWIAARHPAVFDFAVREGCDVMATPLSQPFEEVVSLRQRLDAALSEHPDARRPRFMVLRDTCVYEDADDWRAPVDSFLDHARHFETLFRNVGGVVNGFAEPADLESFSDRENFRPESLRDNLMFGTPSEVVDKLRAYEEAGVDYFLYGSCFGLDPELSRRSLELFISEVMPAFVASGVS